MRRISIVDLDGCISDDRWRRHLIGEANGAKDRYHEYHKCLLRDEPANLHEIVGDQFVIITGRPVRYRELTTLWLRDVGIEPLYTMMRNDNDHRPVGELKGLMLQALLDVNSYGIQPEEIIDAIDDREVVVAEYRKLGFAARVVRIGETEHENG